MKKIRADKKRIGEEDKSGWRNELIREKHNSKQFFLLGKSMRLLMYNQKPRWVGRLD
jgi:hypothetical protein